MRFSNSVLSLKSISLITTACAAFTSHAFAADLPAAPTVYEAPPALEVINPKPWQGFHIGLIAGHSKLRETVRTPAGVNSPRIDGVSLGGLAGIDGQFGNFVLGAEADTSFSNITGADSRAAAEIDQFSTFRGRLGYAFGNLLLYGTGGLALADVTVKSRDFGSDNKLVKGWTYGGGVEAKLTDTVRIRGEYLYTKLDKERYDFTVPNGSGSAGTSGFHTFRAAISYQLPIL